MKRRLRLAVICDAVEEGWPSMDYVAEMLVKHLQQRHSEEFETVAMRPHLSRRARRIWPGKSGFNADRAITRFIEYPASVLRSRSAFDLFHVADHSYGHLAHVLPTDRVGVFCHDLDAFDPILSGAKEEVPRWRRAMATVQLRGVQRASLVFFSTDSVKERILSERLIGEPKLIKAPYGIAEEYWRHSTDNSLHDPVPAPYLLHVGGNFPRKRLDVLLKVFSEVRKTHPALQLVQVGAQFGDAELALVHRLGIEQVLIRMSALSRRELANLYARSSLVLIPSEREGFGLPLLEALAAGAAVVASDIPSLREIGGDAATFAPVADVASWSRCVLSLLRGEGMPLPRIRREQAERYSWDHHARIVASSYAGLLSLP